MKFAKDIKTAAAHSNSEVNLMYIDASFLNDMRIHDLVALFYSKNLLTSNTSRKYLYNHEMKVIERLQPTL